MGNVGMSMLTIDRYDTILETIHSRKSLDSLDKVKKQFGIPVKTTDQ